MVLGSKGYDVPPNEVKERDVYWLCQKKSAKFQLDKVSYSHGWSTNPS